jgi:GDP/UDP-N,N'-diacetylbacillosamine 2-epimerase (hydrolysing)
MIKKKICFISSTRADYGYLRPLILAMQKSANLQPQLIATGTHFEEKYGNTIDEIRSDLTPDAAVKIISDVAGIDVLQTMSNALLEVGKKIQQLAPDMVVALGDRYEMFAIAASCVALGIPLSHISGGDVTYGANDDIYRHCLTKMSYLHFTSCEKYRSRIIQLGEDPQRVFNVGSLSVEAAKNMKFLSQDELEKEIGFDLKKTMLATFHPVTNELESQTQQFRELLEAAISQQQFYFLFTAPNADASRENLAALLDDYAKKFPQKIKVVSSLGSLKYLSAMNYCVGVIGNSSSGILRHQASKFQP